MLRLDIPGFAPLTLEHLVLDFNGTLARDGRLLDGIVPRLEALAKDLALHVVTGDTHGSARPQLQGLPLTLTVLDPENQAEAKQSFVHRLGADRTICIGNGRNDRLMLQVAVLGIVVAGAEGTAVEALTAAHLFVPHIHDALDLLRTPQRLVATLRG
jgi:soluble P-type ATPase